MITSTGLVRAVLGAATALLLAGCGGGGEPRPDLVVVSTRDGDYAIYAMNADGGRQTRLSEERGEPSSARGVFFQLDSAWSPEGERIAFASGRAGTFDIYVMNADGTRVRRVTTSKARDAHPTWSPDGRRIAFERDDADIYVMPVSGGRATSITGPEASETQPAWSPDGRWIAYVRREPGTDLLEIWLMRSDGSDARKLISPGGRSFSPAWSPDGKEIAFSSNRGRRFFDIYIVGIDGKGLRRLTRTGHDAFEPAWSPDGNTIAFSRGGAIVTIRTDGTSEEEVTDPDNNDSSPAWKPRPPAVTG